MSEKLDYSALQADDLKKVIVQAEKELVSRQKAEVKFREKVVNQFFERGIVKGFIRKFKQLDVQINTTETFKINLTIELAQQSGWADASRLERDSYSFKIKEMEAPRALSEFAADFKDALTDILSDTFALYEFNKNSKFGKHLAAKNKEIETLYQEVLEIEKEEGLAPCQLWNKLCELLK